MRHGFHPSRPKWVKKIFRKDLREICREKYGDDFVVMYDEIAYGRPIGNLEETIVFLELVRRAEKDYKKSGIGGGK